MEIAIIILTILAIISRGDIKIRETRVSVNWFALVDLIIILCYFNK